MGWTPNWTPMWFYDGWVWRRQCGEYQTAVLKHPLGWRLDVYRLDGVVVAEPAVYPDWESAMRAGELWLKGRGYNDGPN